jgi:hypothetical protein
MTKPKKRRTGGAEPQTGRVAKMTKPKKRRTGGAEPEGPEGGPTVNRVSVHHELHNRRLQGGASPTPEAYAHAAEQWQQLPGAVISRTQSSSKPIRPSAAVVQSPSINAENGQQQQQS